MNWVIMGNNGPYFRMAAILKFYILNRLKLESGQEEKMIRDLEEDILLMEEQIQEIKKLRAQIGNLEVQIADYQQIVKELSDKIELLEKNI